MNNLRFLLSIVVIVNSFISNLNSFGANKIVTQNENFQQIELPHFLLPYWPAQNGTVLFTGGPHSYSKGGQLDSIFNYGEGSGLDFAGGAFDVVAMATGQLIDIGCYGGAGGFLDPLGCIMAIRHDVGNTVLIYSHLDPSDVEYKKWLSEFTYKDVVWIQQGWKIGKAGATGSGANGVTHLHLELRNNFSDNSNPGSPVGWETLSYLGGDINSYFIWGYSTGQTYDNNSTFYNYDGVAVKGIPNLITNFRFKDKRIENGKTTFIDRSNITTEVGYKYLKEYWEANGCPSSSFACENNDIDPNTQFAGDGSLIYTNTLTNITGSLLQNSDSGVLISTNYKPPSNDTTPPVGQLTAPTNNSTVITRNVTISAYATDNTNGSGVREVRFLANWPGVDWPEVGADSSAPFSIQWDMCNFNVPQGNVELDIEVFDNAGNSYKYTSDHLPLKFTKNYDCTGSGLPSADQWHAEAWMNKYLAGYVNKSEYWPAGVTNVTYPFIGFEKNFGDGAPYAGFPSDEFSFKIYSNLYFRGGQYHFRVCSDDGVVFEIDGQKVIDEWWDRGGCLQTDRSLDNKYHTLEVRYYENRGNAYIRMYIWGEEFPQPELDEPDGRITSATNNSYVNKNPLTIWADAWDDKSGVDRVKFKLYHCVGGCQWRDLGTDYSAPYRFENWDWSSLEGQQIKLAIDVTDKSGRTRGNAGGETTINLDKTPPTISITSPTSGSIDPDKQVSITVNGSDNASGLSSVKFYAGYDDGTSNYWHEIGVDTNSSDGWGMNWNGTSLPDGTVANFFVSAYDKAGNSGSAIVYGVQLGDKPLKKIFLPAITAGSGNSPTPSSPKMSRISVSSAGSDSNYSSSVPGGNATGRSVSDDGRYYVFVSGSSNLVTGDTNGVMDVFVHDLVTRETKRVSVSSNGSQSNGDSDEPAISGNGRYVTFVSKATNLFPGYNIYEWKGFIHDRETGQTTGIHPGYAHSPSISDDGRFVALELGAHVNVYDRTSGNLSIVSKSSTGALGNAGSFQASISGDGRYIAFVSNATNLVENDTNGVQDIFLHDTVTSTTVRISVSTVGVQGNNHSALPSISSDGRFIAFQSLSSSFHPADTNGASDIYLRDVTTQTTKCISINQSGLIGTHHSGDPTISKDGRYIVFESLAGNLLPGDTNERYDVILFDTQVNKFTLMSPGLSGVQSNGNSGEPSIGNDYIFFYSGATNLILNDNNNMGDAFVFGPIK